MLKKDNKKNKAVRGSGRRALVKPSTPASTLSEQARQPFGDMEELRNDNILQALNESLATSQSPLAKPSMSVRELSDQASKTFEDMEETRMDKLLAAFDKISAPTRI